MPDDQYFINVLAGNVSSTAGEEVDQLLGQLVVGVNLLHVLLTRLGRLLLLRLPNKTHYTVYFHSI